MPVSLTEVGVTFVPISLSEKGVVYMPVRPLKEVWPKCLSVSVKQVCLFILFFYILENRTN